MENEIDDRPKILLSELLQITRVQFYLNKKKRHNSNFYTIKSVLIAFTILNRPVWPSEIVNFINDNNKKILRPSDKMPVGKDVKSQVKYYLSQLIKKEIGIVEKLDGGYYQLAYRIIPPPLEKNIEFYRKHDATDLTVVIPLLETIRDCCDQLIDYFRGDAL